MTAPPVRAGRKGEEKPIATSWRVFDEKYECIVHGIFGIVAGVPVWQSGRPYQSLTEEELQALDEQIGWQPRVNPG